MAGPRIVVTGASGFLGRHLLEDLEDDCEIFGIALRSLGLHAGPAAARVRWHQLDIAHEADLRAAFASIRQSGPVDILVHLAGHYDFTGERSPEYHTTNVVGLRNVLEGARVLGVKDFVFSSSVAACGFPLSGEPLTEASPPDGGTPYAESKRAGEEMLASYRGAFRAWTVRFAALFSDWCEYEPLFRFLEGWLRPPARRRILAGKGRSAVPYLHVQDAVAFVRALLARREALDPAEPLLASPDGATSHRELYEAATAAHFGRRESPRLVPGSLCRGGLWAREIARRRLGLEAFERPWMGRFIDLQLTVDARRTRERLGWSPRPRLGIVRRMPFLVENRKSQPAEWQRRNHAALRSVSGHDNLRVCRLLEARARAVAEAIAGRVADPARAPRFPHFSVLPPAQRRAEAEALLATLADAVRTEEKGLFMNACRDLAGRRRLEGFSLEELSAVLDLVGDLSVLALAPEDPRPAWSRSLYDHLTMTVQFGIDEIEEVFEARGLASQREQFSR